MTGSNMMVLHHILAETFQEILDNQYPQRWIGRGRPHQRPARPESESFEIYHLSAAHKFRG
jgi:hypothetical protein